MTKSDVTSRPILHRTGESLEARLTIAFAASAVARILQDQTEVSIKQIIQALQPVRTIVVAVGDRARAAETAVDDVARDLIHSINAMH